MPKISYLVSTYDSGQYLSEHLHNLLETQTDPDLEVVIVNPDSPGTDGVIAESWAERDNRVNYIFHPEREWYGESWLRAWKAAKGKFVCNSNTDDYHAPRFNEVMYKHMAVGTSKMQVANNEIAFGYAGIQVIDPQRRVLGQGIRPLFDFEKMTYECGAGPQVCWRNDEEFRGKVDWDLMATRASEYRSAFDYWLWLYFMSLGYHGLSVQEMLTVYTQRPDSIENSNKHANNWETYASISEFFPHHMSGQLKHAREFGDFTQLPPREEWVSAMQAGKKWRGK
jgi:glycosyltransferase involved in cell wall biosynthesis